MFAGNTSIGNLPQQPTNNGASWFGNNTKPNTTGLFATNNITTGQSPAALFNQPQNTPFSNNTMAQPTNNTFLGNQQTTSFMQPNNQQIAFGANQQTSNGANNFNAQLQNAFATQQPQQSQQLQQPQQNMVGGLFTNQQANNNNSNGFFSGQ